jgi:endonuclease/exonuclease/phosphatase family metal-dependent hydrolase
MKSQRRFSIATYNIHKCRGMDGRVRPERIVRVLRELNVDVIALQEVVSVSNHSRESDQARYLAEELGLHIVSGGSYGNVILSRYPVVFSHRHNISVAKREERSCLRVDLEVAPGKILHVFNVHLGTNFFERRSQGRQLVDDVIHCRAGGKSARNGPRLVLGDFNEWIPGLASRLLASHLKGKDIRELLTVRRTYPGLFPLMHLDHIFYDDTLELIRAKLRRSPLTLTASDHLPIVAEFLYREH